MKFAHNGLTGKKMGKTKNTGGKAGAKEEAETSQSPESVKGLFVPHSAGVSAAHSQCLARACIRTRAHTYTVHRDHEAASGDGAQSHLLSVPASFSRLTA